MRKAGEIHTWHRIRKVRRAMCDTTVASKSSGTALIICGEVLYSSFSFMKVYTALVLPYPRRIHCHWLAQGDE